MNDEDLLKRIEQLEARNKRVEAEKEWETSWLRRLLIAVLTYVIIVIYLHIIDVANPWINAVIPMLGYVLSTLGLSIIKKWWLQRR